MDELTMGILFGLAGIVIGFLLGVAATDGSWTNDCDALGVHRHGNAVYICKPQGKEKAAH